MLCSNLHLLLLVKHTSCSSPARCTAHVNTPKYTLVHVNSTHLLKLLKQTQMIILKQSRPCSHKPSCQQKQLLSEGQLIASTKRAVMSYSSPAFLWANIHLLLIMQENNVQLFCLLLIENSVSWKEKEQTQLKNWVILISLI